MDTSKRQGIFYSFCKGVISVLAFAICFYLFVVCFVATYRLISDIGDVRVIFLNPVLVLFLAIIIFFASSVYVLKSKKITLLLSGLEKDETFKRVMTALKIAVFIECLVFSFGIGNMGQRVDQLEIQQAAYSFSWGDTTPFTPPGYLGICPNNSGMAVIVYLLSFITGHYNNLVIMLINGVMVPFIYSDLSEIGGKFGLSKKSRVLIMICGLIFIPLQAKSMIVYGEIPGLFLSVRAMKHTVDIVQTKSRLKNIFIVTAFIGFACVLKNNFLIYAIAIAIYLAVELIRQKRFKELYIPAAVILAAVLFMYAMNLIIGAVIGHAVSKGESYWAYIAMGMQEDGGMFNGYNAETFARTGFDTDAQSVIAKEDIKNSLNAFMTEPNYALGFYLRKTLIQWSDPLHCSMEYISRNVYLENNSSPFIWFFANPRVVRVVASFLKVFQLLMFLGGIVFAFKEGRSKKGSPALLLFLTLIGGYIFHTMWESSPFYTLSYMTVLIPVGAAGIVSLAKKISAVKPAELAKVKIQVDSGIVYFLAGMLVFLFAAAGIGTIKTQLVDGRKKYISYFNDVLDQSRNPAAPGYYRLKPATEGYTGEGIPLELIRYAGKYRIRVVAEGYEAEDAIFMTCGSGTLGINWFSYESDQVFAIVRNDSGTYSIFHGETDALSYDETEDKFEFADFTDFTFTFNTDGYNEQISGNPNFTWYLEPEF